MFRRRLCCCVEHEDCLACQNGTTPLEFDVTIAGVANGDCDQCTNLNGTFRLTQDASLCRWYYNDVDGIAACVPFLGDGEWDRIDIYIAVTGVFSTKIEIYARKEVLSGWTGDTDRMEWELIMPSLAPDCISFEDLDIPQSRNSVYGDCDNSSATCTITSVPL